VEGKWSTGVYSSFVLKKLGELCTYVGEPRECQEHMKWQENGLQVFGLGSKLGRVQVRQILIKYCSFEPSFLPVFASHTTLLCSVLQFLKHSFWGRGAGAGGGVVWGGGHNNI
jgi:hypothetical protein